MPLSGVYMISETTSLASSRRCRVLVLSFFCAPKENIVMLNNNGMTIRNRICSVTSCLVSACGAVCIQNLSLAAKSEPSPSSIGKDRQFPRHYRLHKGLRPVAREYGQHAPAVSATPEKITTPLPE